MSDGSIDMSFATAAIYMLELLIPPFFAARLVAESICVYVW
jgi:hypothetical protein